MTGVYFNKGGLYWYSDAVTSQSIEEVIQAIHAGGIACAAI